MREKGRRFLRTLFLTACLWCGAGLLPVQAASMQSHGNLIYEGAGGGAGLYAADIMLLAEKLSSIPARCFDPVCYSHTHTWEYRGVNERTHTRHCADCGASNDLTDVHRADRTENDTILYEGKSYPGKRFTCACGYQWTMELTHTMRCEAVDAVSHRSRCELDGTPYCRGCEPSVEEHYAWYYEDGSKPLHHAKICFDCGYWTEEACLFEPSKEDEERRVCVCGSTAPPEESETPETPPEEPETPDAPPEEPETPDMPSEEPETPDTPSEEPETPDTPSERPETPPENITNAKALSEKIAKSEMPPENITYRKPLQNLQYKNRRSI